MKKILAIILFFNFTCFGSQSGVTLWSDSGKGVLQRSSGVETTSRRPDSMGRKGIAFLNDQGTGLLQVSSNKEVSTVKSGSRRAAARPAKRRRKSAEESRNRSIDEKKFEEESKTFKSMLNEQKQERDRLLFRQIGEVKRSESEDESSDLLERKLEDDRKQLVEKQKKQIEDWAQKESDKLHEGLWGKAKQLFGGTESEEEAIKKSAEKANSRLQKWDSEVRDNVRKISNEKGIWRYYAVAEAEINNLLDEYRNATSEKDKEKIRKRLEDLMSNQKAELKSINEDIESGKFVWSDKDKDVGTNLALYDRLEEEIVSIYSKVEKKINPSSDELHISQSGDESEEESTLPSTPREDEELPSSITPRKTDLSDVGMRHMDNHSMPLRLLGQNEIRHQAIEPNDLEDVHMKSVETL